MNKLKVYSVAAAMAVAGLATVASGAFAASASYTNNSLTTTSAVTISADGHALSADFSGLAYDVASVTINGTWSQIVDTWAATNLGNFPALAAAPALILNVSGTATPVDADLANLATFNGGVTINASRVDLRQLSAGADLSGVSSSAIFVLPAGTLYVTDVLLNDYNITAVNGTRVEIAGIVYTANPAGIWTADAPGGGTTTPGNIPSRGGNTGIGR